MNVRDNGILIKKPETDDEIKGKAFVHWKSWHEAYAGIVNREYLDALSLEKCEDIALEFPGNTYIAKDGEKVVGFVSYAPYRDDELPDTGEIVAIYVLAEYYGKGVGTSLLQAAIDQLDFPQIALWVLKDNHRAIRFYEKMGFHFDGCEQSITLGTPLTEIRMTADKIDIVAKRVLDRYLPAFKELAK